MEGAGCCGLAALVALVLLAGTQSSCRAASTCAGPCEKENTNSSSADACINPLVEVLVSPVANVRELRILHISWDVGDQWAQGDWVGLYDGEPKAGVSPRFRANARGARGKVRTGISEGRTFKDPDYTKKCLGWWAAYWRPGGETPVVTSCLSSNPSWMSEYRDEIGEMKLNSMFLPGTHDSGAYQLSYRPFKEFRLDKYTYTQDENIEEQLIHGARVLDLRVGLGYDKFWIYHGPIRIRPLESVLYEIKNFIDNTNEIVIIDIHEIDRGFESSTDHKNLIDYIKSKLGNHMAPPHLGWGTTLNSLWAIKKRVIVAYNNKDIIKKNPNDVWWPVTQMWGNKRTIDSLFQYFSNIFTKGMKKGVLWCAMAELTPSAWDVISNKLRGLRNMADTTNSQITAWFRGDWGFTVNAVSMDFIRSSGIVDAAIRWNRRRAKDKKCD